MLKKKVYMLWEGNEKVETIHFCAYLGENLFEITIFL